MHVAIGSDAFINCQLFPAQRQDCKSIEALWHCWPWATITHVVADKAYDSCRIRNYIKSHQAEAVIPPKGVYLPQGSHLSPEDFYDTRLYRKRNCIERLFGRMKENKRIAMRFDKLDTCFLGFIALALAKLFKLFC